MPRKMQEETGEAHDRRSA